MVKALPLLLKKMSNAKSKMPKRPNIDESYTSHPTYELFNSYIEVRPDDKNGPVPTIEQTRAELDAYERRYADAILLGLPKPEKPAERPNYASCVHDLCRDNTIGKLTEKMLGWQNDGLLAPYKDVEDCIRRKTGSEQLFICRTLHDRAGLAMKRRDRWVAKMEQSPDRGTHAAFDMWEAAHFGFIADRRFRQEFKDALLEDGLPHDTVSFWHGVDRLREHVELQVKGFAGDRESMKGLLFEGLCNMTVILVTACFLGALDRTERSSDMLPEATLQPGRVEDGSSSEVPRQREDAARADVVAQLVAIVFTGDGPSDYYVECERVDRDQGDARVYPRVYPITAGTKGFLLGRDGTWGQDQSERWSRPYVGSVTASRRHCMIVHGREDGKDVWKLVDVGSGYHAGAGVPHVPQGSSWGTLVVRGRDESRGGGASYHFLRGMRNGEAFVLEHGDIIVLAPLPGDEPGTYRWEKGLVDMCFRFEVVSRKSEYNYTGAESLSGGRRSRLVRDYVWTDRREQVVRVTQ